MSIKREAIWVLLSTGISAVTLLSIYGLLAHTESPEALGQLAIINVVLSIAFLLQDMGLSSYFIHRQNLSIEERSTLFYINVAFGLLATFIVFTLSHPLGEFYNSVQISDGLKLISINFLIIGISSQYQANYIKHLKNNNLAKIEISSRFSLLILSTVLIYFKSMSINGYLYSLIIANLIKLLLLVFNSDKDWHPKLKLNRKILSPAINFGAYQMSSQIINQLRTQADQLIIGKWLGIETLGVYAVAKELVLQPMKLVSPICAKIVLPRLAKAQNERNKYLDICNYATGKILLFNCTVFILLSSFLYVFSEKIYEGSNNQVFFIFLSLLLLGLLRPVGTIFALVAQSKGLSKLEFHWNIIASCIFFASLVIALPFKKLEAFAYAISCSQLILSLYAPHFFNKKLMLGSLMATYKSIIFILILFLAINIIFRVQLIL